MDRTRTRSIRRVVATLVVVATVVAGCSSSSGDLLAPASGGDTTATHEDSHSTSTPAPNLDTLERRRFEDGDRLFRRTWVAAASTAGAGDGLGPLFNADSCAACHTAERDRAATDAEAPGLLLRVGDRGAAWPVFGGQIQDRSIAGVPPEGRVVIEYVEIPGTYPDGTAYSLRLPSYAVELRDGSRSGGPFSPRIPSSVFGMALLEAIPDAAIMANADPDDSDGDGISGRVSRVWSAAGDRESIGRLGWKATVATVRDQVALAFHEDIGITSDLHPDENCTPAQSECLAAVDGASPELSGDALADVVFYVSTLAVPRRRALGTDEVRGGAELFAAIGCTACHTATFTTGDHPIDAIANQVIHPFTDLLLHDMGPALADDLPDGSATGTEWRTAPLWGLGNASAIPGSVALLHDGRARSIEEAILWHGGEGDAARERFVRLDEQDRARVIAFLESL